MLGIRSVRRKEEEEGFADPIEKRREIQLRILDLIDLCKGGIRILVRLNKGILGSLKLWFKIFILKILF